LLPWWLPVVFFLGDSADVARFVAFFAGVALWPALASDGATLGLCGATRGFLKSFGCSAGRGSGLGVGGFGWNAVHRAFSFAGDYRSRRIACGGEFGPQMGADGGRC
jgi:hypothetical protein